MCLLIGFLISLYIFYRIYQHFFPTPDIDTKGKYVLISGCDSGFGNALAIELDRKGFNVLAGVLVHDNIKVLKEKLSSNATVFSLDITRQDDIDAAYELVKTKTSVLHALVNNAGIAITGFIDWATIDDIHKVMNVNFFGHVAMTKKFLPLLIAKRDSRVVNICSVAGFLSFQGMSAYCASKYALESFSDCLRREMSPWGLQVSIVEPGFMRTAIITSGPKSFEEIWCKLPSDVQERWGEDYLKARFTEAKIKGIIKHAEDPMKVVRVLQHAVMNTVPRIRYRPGWQSSWVFYPISFLPARIVDWIVKQLDVKNQVPAGVQKQRKD